MKISKQTREEAANLCSALASHEASVMDGGFITRFGFFGAPGKWSTDARSIAYAVWVVSVSDRFDVVGRLAEAEAMLSNGWTP